MVNYKDLGLVNTREMFKKAVAGGYAIPAFNFNTMEQMQAIVQAAVETKSPVIMQVSKGARNYANATILRYMAEGAVAYAKELGCAHPEIVLHLDHGDSFELCKDCIDMGFSSVMIDGSSLPYEDNIALTKKVVEYAHQYDVTVEALRSLTTPSPRRSSTSLPVPAATHWLSLSELLTVLTSSSPSSAPATRRPVVWFLLPWLSTCCMRLRRSSPDSPSCSTALLQYLRTRSTPSTSSVATCPTPLVFPRSSSVRLPRALSARLTSTQTLVWQ